MKKIILVIIIISVAGISFFMFDQDKDIELVINDELIEPDNPVLLEDEVLYVPANPVFETLGAYTRWDPVNEVFHGILGEYELHLPVDSHEVTVDGETVAWNEPVILVDDTVYVPAAPAAEALGAFVEWDDEARQVIISTPQEFDPELEEEQEGPLLHASYPPPYQFNYYADTLFVFGTTRSYSQVDVIVNGEPVDMINRKTGNFLTMIDIPRGEEYTVRIEATDGVDTTTVERTVIYPAGLQAMPEDPLEIHSSHVIPRGNQVLNPGDSLRIAARGSPGATAYYQIGEGSYNQMTELQSPGGPPGRGGIYTAVHTVSSYDVPAEGMTETMPVRVILDKGGQQVSRELPGQVAFFSDVPYKVLEVREEPALDYSGWFRMISDDSYQIYSNTPGGTGHPDKIASYLTEGTRFEAVGASGNYYRVRLEEDEIYLLHKDAVRELEDKEHLDPSLTSVEISETSEKVSLRFNSDERFPFLVESGTDHLAIKLYGIDKDEGLEMAESSGSVQELSLEPMAGEPEAYILKIQLDRSFTGFTPSWKENNLIVDIAKPPSVDQENPLQGKTIVVDPGHGGEDLGAPGPGHLYEKDVVLEMSLYLQELLLKEGAEVIMTRIEDVDVDLYDRPKAEFINETDFFISVHANAHGHGADAVNTHGIMTLYNYDHNEKLADIMLDRVTEKMDLPALYTWRRNIAVTRHTQFPCVLVEAGYMMHPEDNWHILHPRGQQQFAAAMVEGIKEYFLSFTE